MVLSSCLFPILAAASHVFEVAEHVLDVVLPLAGGRGLAVVLDEVVVCIYDTKDGVRSAYVNPHYIGFFHV